MPRLAEEIFQSASLDEINTFYGYVPDDASTCNFTKVERSVLLLGLDRMWLKKLREEPMWSPYSPQNEAMIAKKNYIRMVSTRSLYAFLLQKIFGMRLESSVSLESTVPKEKRGWGPFKF